MCRVEDYDGLELDKIHRNFVDTELDMWHEYYLPKDGVKGKVVVDMGAGCGETPFFYLQHGASRVIAIESDPECLRMLNVNFKDDERVQVVPARIGFIKMDIEGAEKNMIIESHFLPHLQQIKLVGRGSGGPAILTRYASYQKTSSILGWLHMERISMAHRIRLLVEAI